MSLDGLLDAQGFYRENASMSYPGSAVYNRFLLDHLEIPEYLALYLGHGAGADMVMNMRIDADHLPDAASWMAYLSDQPEGGGIRPGAPGLESAPRPTAFQPLSGGAHFGFAVPGTTLVHDGPPSDRYRSFLFEDFLADETYAGERYFLRASAGEVAVYDLHINTMIAWYASGFSEDPVEIPVTGGRFLFQVDRAVFPANTGAVDCRYIE